jgi:anti-sigma28 factor (negative regulator of flagellin synthesis)
MTEITNIHSNRLPPQATSRLESARSNGRADPASQDTRTGSSRTDQVELSDHSRFLNQLRTQDIRQDAVQGVRAQIDTETYLTDARIDGSLDELAYDLDITG